MNGPLPIAPWQLAVAASLILVNGLLSVWLRLGMEKRLVVAALRTVVQLTLLGFVLAPVFTWNHPAPVLALGLLMVALATREAIRRSERTHRGVYGSVFLALLLSCGTTAVLGADVIVGVRPWWTPQYVVPLLGMMLGNSLSGISIGLDRVLSGLDEGRDRVETLLAFGATRWEAARPVVTEAIRTGMTPIVNSMNVVGLVTIPGILTGQILAGADPVLAARYQVVIMFLIAASVAVGVGIAVLLAVRACFDDEERLRPERIRRR